MTIWVEGNNKFVLSAGAQLVSMDHEEAADAWWAKHVRTSPTFRWLVGRFVEADRANSNRQLFSMEGLQMARPSITHAPMNLNHFQRRIIGAYVATDMIYPVEGASELNPHIEALGVVWQHFFGAEVDAIEHAHSEGNLAFCVDEETEMLTAAGWKRHSELEVGEEILTLNTTANASEWLPLEKVHVYPDYSGDLISMEGMMHSSLTTPNHKWWVKRRASRSHLQPTWEWRTTETLTGMTQIPRAVPSMSLPDVETYTDEFVELVGWFWTEGSHAGAGAEICQSRDVNPEFCERIEATCRRLFGEPARVRDGGTWYVTERGGKVTFHLSKAAATDLKRVVSGRDKIVEPFFIRSLTERQLRLFIDVSIMADGTEATSDGQVSIVQGVEGRLRSFEMACALVGIPTNTTRFEIGTGPYKGREMWRTCLVRRSDLISPVRDAQLSRRRSDPGTFTVERSPFEGLVWCPQTRNGTFLARRRGTVYWTGNSMECVPRQVECTGDDGCGEIFEYAGRKSDSYCNHLNEFASDKLLIDPLFTAGAVLVGVQPGWRHADIHSLVAEYTDDQLESIYQDVAETHPEWDPVVWEASMHALLHLANG